MLERVISGGQTGADRAGLYSATDVGIPTGGWMPRGFRAQDGSRPEFAELFGSQEHTSERYPPRTALNVKESDATLRFASDWDSPGEVLTRQLCERYQRPFFDISRSTPPAPEVVVDWLQKNRVRVLNIAGNSERTSPGIEEFVRDYLRELFRLCREAGVPHAECA